MKIDDSGVARLQAKFVELSRSMKDPRPLSQFVALLAVRETKKNFDKQKNEDGTSWPRLKTRPGGTPLINKRGRMQKGVTSEQTAKGFVVGAAEESKAWNAAVNYGSRMWKNSGHKKGNPQRQFMFLTKAAAALITKEIKAFIDRRLRA